MRSSRVLPSVAALLATATLAACTTNSQVCKDGVCKISLSGKGSTSTLGGEGGDTVELVSADGTTAKIKIAGQSGEVKAGQVIDLNNGQIKVTEVKENKIKLEVTTAKSTTDNEQTDASGDAS
jgi:hypothetical protein